MKLNRREFISTTAAAVAAAHVTSPADAQPARTLSITYHGLSVIAIGRAPTVKGMPTSTPRVDVLFVKNVAHASPLLFGSGVSLNLENADLRILVGGKPLPGNLVTLSTAPVATCPTNSLEWANLQRVPEFDSILSQSVTVKSSALTATNPTGVTGRVTMRVGTLRGEIPVKAYDGASWSFPGGNTAYVRAFTDTLLWRIAIPAGDVTFEAVKFDGTSSVKPVSVTAAGSVAINIEAQRIDRTPPSAPEPQIDHFRHYYDLLDFTGTTKPIPTRTTSTCVPVQLTNDQKLRFQRSLDLRTQFLRPDDDCGDSGEGLMRGEPGICVSGIAYADFK